MTSTEPERELAGLETFTTWYERVEPRLRRSLVAAYGSERGREATADALAWAWEHRDRLDDLRQPLGFLFRVGQSRIRGGGSQYSTEPWTGANRGSSQHLEKHWYP